MSLSLESISKIILFVLIFVILLVGIAIFTSEAEDKSIDLVCRGSIELGGKTQLISNNIDYKCESKENDFSDLSKLDSYKQISLELKRCHELFSYGKNNIFPNLGEGESVCGVCSFNNISETIDFQNFTNYINSNPKDKNYFSQIMGLSTNQKSPFNWFENVKTNQFLIGVKFTKSLHTFEQLKENSVVGYVNNMVGFDASNKQYLVEDATLYSAAVGAGVYYVSASLLAASAPVTGTAVVVGAAAGGIYSIFYNLGSYITSEEAYYTSLIVGDLEKSKLNELGCDRVIF